MSKFINLEEDEDFKLPEIVIPKYDNSEESSSHIQDIILPNTSDNEILHQRDIKPIISKSNNEENIEKVIIEKFNKHNIDEPSEYLKHKNYLGEFVSEEEKTKARNNLNIKNDLIEHNIKLNYYEHSKQLTLEDLIKLLYVKNIPDLTNASIVNQPSVSILSPNTTNKYIGTKIDNIIFNITASLNSGVQMIKNTNSGILNYIIKYYNSNRELQTLTNSELINWNESVIDQNIIINFPIDLYFGINKSSLYSIQINFSGASITFDAKQIETSGGKLKGISGIEYDVTLQGVEPDINIIPEISFELNEFNLNKTYSCIIPCYQSDSVNSYQNICNLGNNQWNRSGYYYFMVPKGTKVSIPIVQTSVGDQTLGIHKLQGEFIKSFINDDIIYDQYVLTNGTTTNPYKVDIESGKYLKISFS